MPALETIMVNVYIHPLLKYFKCDHLPAHLKKISLPFADLALKMNMELKPCEEMDFCMRKLLEAKDCAVRSAIPETKEIF